jgi:hypothetical protein
MPTIVADIFGLLLVSAAALLIVYALIRLAEISEGE